MPRELKEISLDLIDPPGFEIRTEMSREKLEELADSIKQFGVLEPLLVTPQGERYRIVAGHRRFLAAQIAELFTVPCIIWSGKEEELTAILTHENIKREDVSPTDLARCWQYLTNKFGYIQKDIAHLMGVSQAYVSQIMEILDYPENVRAAIQAGHISFRAGHWISKIEDEKDRNFYLEQAVKGGASVLTVQAWYNDYLRQKGATPPARAIQPALTGEEEAPSPSFICASCNERIPSAVMFLARLCPECKGFLESIWKSKQWKGIIEDEKKEWEREYSWKREKVESIEKAIEQSVKLENTTEKEDTK